jgi:hypothetical protein
VAFVDGKSGGAAEAVPVGSGVITCTVCVAAGRRVVVVIGVTSAVGVAVIVGASSGCAGTCAGKWGGCGTIAPKVLSSRMAIMTKFRDADIAHSRVKEVNKKTSYLVAYTLPGEGSEYFISRQTGKGSDRPRSGTRNKTHKDD